MFDIDFSRLIEQLLYQPDSPMIFSSGIFLFLFLGFTLIYNCLGKADTLRILFVTLFSYYFYYKSSGLFFWLLALVTTSDYFIAKAIGTVKEKGGLAKTLVVLSLILDLGLLVFFKYTNFLGDTICTLLEDNGIHVPSSISGSYLQGVAWQPRDIFLPVGISFFTFQSLSYTIDVYRGNIKPLNRLLDYAFYVSFFPQLVAGPIVRARDFIPQIRRPLMVTDAMFGTGVFYIIAGLFKKAVISDYISINFVERIFDQPDLYSGLENLLAVYGYTLQIYCDFSGYSDMAIGIALLLGFEFPKNFDSPYKSASITEFWRRWHISLSSWLKDYLYISLGGNRHGKFRQYFNLLMTMLLGGLWHGASLNFILWGGIHGILLCLDKIWHSLCPKLSPLSGLPSKYNPQGEKRPARGLVGGIITFHLVAACWVLFRAPSFGIAEQVFMQIFHKFEPQIFFQWCTSYKAVGALMLLGYVLHFMPESLSDKAKTLVTKSPLLVKALLIVLLIWVVIQIKSSDVQPFIYFQF
ncbi:MAG: MBOAT family protein [Bacteroidaceae bacterium]|nr:MBOAT family protein [Bacteroidaceae bacterium]